MTKSEFLKRNGKNVLYRLWTFLAYMGRLSLYTWKQLVRDKCLTSASALAFATLTATIPVATVAFSLYKAFGGLAGFEDDIKRKVFEWLLSVPTVGHERVEQIEPPKQPGAEEKSTAPDAQPAETKQPSLDAIAQDYAETVSQWVTKLSDQLGRYTVNAISLSALIIIAVFLLHTIEGAFNDIWHVQQKRRFLYKFVVFWAVVSLGPVLIGASIYLSWSVIPYLRSVPGLQALSKLVGLLPLLISIIVFYLTYYFLPNARVRWSSALAGAVVAAILWELAKRGMYLYAFLVVPYSKIYGSLGLALIFMLWLFLTWVIVLFGAEVSYTSQNLHALRYLEQRSKVHFSPLSEVLALRVVLVAAKSLLEGRGPLSVLGMARELGVAEDEVRPLTDRLVATRLLTVVTPATGAFAHDMQFVLAKAPEALQVREVLQCVREDMGWALTGASPHESNELTRLFGQFDQSIQAVLGNLNLTDLVRRVQHE